MQSNHKEITLFIIIGTLLILSLVVFTILILFLYQKKQVTFLESLETLKHDHEKNLLKTQLEIQEQTFQNISREIHDNIGLSLTLAKLNLNILDFEKIEQIKELINTSIDLISKSINDLSDISKCLNSESISQQGLLNALQLEIQRLNNLKRFKVEFQVSGNPVFFDSQKELVLFRIAQEALNNIIKHADAQNIYLHVIFNNNEVQLCIKDNGKGFSFEKEISSPKKIKAGLTNMHIRSAMINGSMKVESEIGKGTAIIVKTPLDLTES